MKCFSIREKVLLPNHEDIGKSLCKIGKCYEHLNQLKLALEYYKQAIIIYQQCFTFWDPDLNYLEFKIEELSEQIDQINI